MNTQDTQTMLPKDYPQGLSPDDLLENILPKHLDQMFKELAEERKAKEQAQKG